MSPTTNLVVQAAAAAQHSAAQRGQCVRFELSSVLWFIAVYALGMLIFWGACVWFRAFEEDAFNVGLASAVWPASVPVLAVRWVLKRVRPWIEERRDNFQRPHPPPDRGAGAYRRRENSEQ